MYTLSYPWLLLLVLLPPVLRRLLPAYRESRRALAVPWFQRMADLLGQTPSPGAVVTRAKVLELLFLWLLWAILVVAIARPQFLEPPISRVVPTRDMMLLVEGDVAVRLGELARERWRRAHGWNILPPDGVGPAPWPWWISTSSAWRI